MIRSTMEQVESSIKRVRTEGEIALVNPGSTRLHLCVEGPHQKSGISHLTMGNYQNYEHTRYTPRRIDGHWYINVDRVINNSQLAMGGHQYPLDWEKMMKDITGYGTVAALRRLIDYLNEANNDNPFM